MKKQKLEQNLIRNCSWGYSCDKKWSDLSETSDKKIRFCNTCQREVHYSEDKDQLTNNIALNRCVSFSSDILENKSSPSWGKQKAPQKATPVQYNEPIIDFDDDIPF